MACSADELERMRPALRHRLGARRAAYGGAWEGRSSVPGPEAPASAVRAVPMRVGVAPVHRYYATTLLLLYSTCYSALLRCSRPTR